MNRLTARLYDRIFRPSEEAGLADARRTVLASARGAVLEIGAGTGLNLKAYPREGIVRLVVLEPDPNMARHLREKLSEAPLAPEVVEAPAERMPFADDTFDAVCCFAALYLIEDPMAAIAELVRVLAPGGRIALLSSCHRGPLPVHRTAPLVRAVTGVRVFGREELVDALEDEGLEGVEQRVSGLAQFVCARDGGGPQA